MKVHAEVHARARAKTDARLHKIVQVNTHVEAQANGQGDVKVMV